MAFNQKYWLDTIGLKMKDALRKHHYPDLELNHFSTQDCQHIHSILSEAPKDETVLKKIFIKRVLRGRIEEIEKNEEALFFHIKIRHKQEMYIVLMKLAGIDWSFVSLEYTGKTTQKPIIWSLSTALALSVLLSTLLLMQNMTEQSAAVPADMEADAESNQTDSPDGNSDAYTLEELENFAAEQGHVLYSEEQFEQVVDLYIEDALAAYEAELEEENEKRENENGDGEEEGEERAEGEEENAEDTTVEIVIESGMSSHDIAGVLTDHNLARDTRELAELIEALDVENLMRSGSFEIPGNATYMEMIEILTGQSS